MSESITLYAPLAKVAAAPADDGSLTVSGYASSEAVDKQGETVTADAIKAAIPDFMKSGTGALREMHASVAAGIVTKIKVDSKGRTEVTAKVYDGGTIKKLQGGVFRGFSVGGKVIARDSKDRKKITKIRLDEISLVDVPANAEATLELIKVAGAATVKKPLPNTPALGRLIKDTLDKMTPDERAVLLTKAALQLPRRINF